MGRKVCSVIILVSSFYAWLMTATGIQLTQYRPAFAGLVGEAQPYVLAGLVHVAITYYYLRLASPLRMGRRQIISMVVATPFVFLFVVWTVFMSSYSIMFERRTETAHVESGNQLQSIADELRDLDRQVADNFSSTLTNLDQRLESEQFRPDPGVIKGCGKRCREIRAVQSEMQNFQHLRTPTLTRGAVSNDLARALGTLEGEQQTIAARLADFDAALAKFSKLNAVLAERTVTPTDEVSSRLSVQFRSHLDRLKVKLSELRDDERNLTDTKYRGLTELVNDLSSVLASGQLARILDMFTILLIAVAPDFLSLIMALLARSLVPDEPPPPTQHQQGEGFGALLKGLRTGFQRRSTAQDVARMNATVKEHLAARIKADPPPVPAAPGASPPPPPPPEDAAAPPSASGKVQVQDTIYQTLDKMDMPIPFKRPNSTRI